MASRRRRQDEDWAWGDQEESFDRRSKNQRSIPFPKAKTAGSAGVTTAPAAPPSSAKPSTPSIFRSWNADPSSWDVGASSWDDEYENKSWDPPPQPKPEKSWDRPRKPKKNWDPTGAQGWASALEAAFSSEGLAPAPQPAAQNWEVPAAAAGQAWEALVTQAYANQASLAGAEASAVTQAWQEAAAPQPDAYQEAAAAQPPAEQNWAESAKAWVEKNALAIKAQQAQQAQQSWGETPQAPQADQSWGEPGWGAIASEETQEEENEDTEPQRRVPFPKARGKKAWDNNYGQEDGEGSGGYGMVPYGEGNDDQQEGEEGEEGEEGQGGSTYKKNLNTMSDRYSSLILAVKQNISDLESRVKPKKDGGEPGSSADQPDGDGEYEPEADPNNQLAVMDEPQPPPPRDQEALASIMKKAARSAELNSESAAVAPPVPLLSREKCVDFMMGVCSRGDQCKFRHEAMYPQLEETVEYPPRRKGSELGKGGKPGGKMGGFHGGMLEDEDDFPEKGKGKGKKPSKSEKQNTEMVDTLLTRWENDEPKPAPIFDHEEVRPKRSRSRKRRWTRSPSEGRGRDGGRRRSRSRSPRKRKLTREEWEEKDAERVRRQAGIPPKFEDACATKELVIDKKYISRLIGKAGYRISEIRQASGADISIRQGGPSEGACRVVIVSNPSKVSAAEAMIWQAIGIEPGSDIRELVVPPEHVSAIIGAGGTNIAYFRKASGGIQIGVRIPEDPSTTPHKVVIGPAKPEQLDVAVRLICDKITENQADMMTRLSDPESSRLREVPCTFFAAGKCRKGTLCPFSHTRAPALEQIPDQ